MHAGFEEIQQWISKTVAPGTQLQILVLDPAEAFRDTPLEAWYAQEDWQHTALYGVPAGLPFEKTVRVHAVLLSDALRLAVLYKQGGIYLDTDAVPISPELVG